MSRIRSIQVVGGNNYHLGDERYGHSLPIGEIRDKSLEHSDRIYFMYQVLDTSGELMAEIICCPVEVEYEGETKAINWEGGSDDIPF